MKYVKNIIYNLTFVAFLLIVFSYFAFLAYSFFSPRAIRSKRNVQNSEGVEVGMNVKEVLQIMGEPDSIYTSYYNDEDFVYYYVPPIMASDGIEIHINDSTKRVRAVKLYQ